MVRLGQARVPDEYGAVYPRNTCRATTEVIVAQPAERAGNAPVCRDIDNNTESNNVRLC